MDDTLLPWLKATLENFAADKFNTGKSKFKFKDKNRLLFIANASTTNVSTGDTIHSLLLSDSHNGINGVLDQQLRSSWLPKNRDAKELEGRLLVINDFEVLTESGETSTIFVQKAWLVPDFRIGASVSCGELLSKNLSSSRTNSRSDSLSEKQRSQENNTVVPAAVPFATIPPVTTSAHIDEKSTRADYSSATSSGNKRTANPSSSGVTVPPQEHSQMRGSSSKEKKFFVRERSTDSFNKLAASSKHSAAGGSPQK